MSTGHTLVVAARFDVGSELPSKKTVRLSLLTRGYRLFEPHAKSAPAPSVFSAEIYG